MARINIEIQNDEALRLIKAVGIINNIDVSTKEKQVNLGLEIVQKFAQYSDSDTFESLTQLKKQI